MKNRLIEIFNQLLIFPIIIALVSTIRKMLVLSTIRKRIIPIN